MQAQTLARVRDFFLSCLLFRKLRLPKTEAIIEEEKA